MLMSFSQFIYVTNYNKDQGTMKDNVLPPKKWFDLTCDHYNTYQNTEICGQSWYEHEVERDDMK